jgi:hypothetical protein
MPAQMPRGRFPALTVRRPIGGVFPVSAKQTVRPFRSPKFYGAFSLAGVTRDSTGTPLGTCTVKLFEAATDIEVGQTTSDGAGAFTFRLGNNAGYFYLVAYKPGSPDVAGTSVNTLALTQG